MNRSVAVFVALLKVDLLNFCRNKTAAFWTFAFPLLLLFIFMGSFGSPSGLGTLNVRFDDQDRSTMSADFSAYLRYVLKQQDALQVRFDQDGEDGQHAMTVALPAGFQHGIEAGQTVSVRLSGGPEGLAGQVATRIIAASADAFALRALRGAPGIRVIGPTAAAVAAPINYAGYLVTGLLCMVVVSTSLMGFVIPLVQAREQGHFRVFELVPAPRVVVVLALALSKLIVILLSGLVLFLCGAALYQLGLPLAPMRYAVALTVLVTGVAGFLALAMALAARMQNSDWANITCNLIYFPLVLLGNLFIPIERGGMLGKVLNQMPVNLFVKALRGTLLQGDELAAHGQFLVVFLVMIAASLAYCSQAFVLNRGVQEAT